LRLSSAPFTRTGRILSVRRHPRGDRQIERIASVLLAAGMVVLGLASFAALYVFIDVCDRV
jgi:hypothetical protein